MFCILFIMILIMYFMLSCHHFVHLFLLISYIYLGFHRIPFFFSLLVFCCFIQSHYVDVAHPPMHPYKVREGSGYWGPLMGCQGPWGPGGHQNLGPGAAGSKQGRKDMKFRKKRESKSSKSPSGKILYCIITNIEG